MSQPRRIVLERFVFVLMLLLVCFGLKLGNLYAEEEVQPDPVLSDYDDYDYEAPEEAEYWSIGNPEYATANPELKSPPREWFNAQNEGYLQAWNEAIGHEGYATDEERIAATGTVLDAIRFGALPPPKEDSETDWVLKGFDPKKYGHDFDDTYKNVLKRQAAGNADYEEIYSDQFKQEQNSGRSSEEAYNTVLNAIKSGALPQPTEEEKMENVQKILGSSLGQMQNAREEQEREALFQEMANGAGVSEDDLHRDIFKDLGGINSEAYIDQYNQERASGATPYKAHKNVEEAIEAGALPPIEVIEPNRGGTDDSFGGV
ncbi:MAG: hypothetical protein PHY94_05250 [Candidatus Omnitrophica bacterium]|nr:hypothetical protein [Candidatus Omnitrophota bacterium]